MLRQKGGSLKGRKQKRKVASWLLDALRVLRPPERMTVSQWADRNRIMDAKTSARPGPWRTSTTPYLAGIMDAFNDPEIEEISFCKSTQVGGTECLNNCMGYVINQDPSPAMVVYPTDKLAKYASDNRIQPMVQLCPSLRVEFNFQDSQDLELQFQNMYLVLSGANSPSSLASYPIRYLFLDEVDKYPATAGKEADPINLARERTNSFETSRKILQASTPTFKTGNIWKALEAANELRRFFIPCPHCGAYQHLQFAQLKWPEGCNADDARDLAYYECEHCKERITDADKAIMLRAGEWQAVNVQGAGHRLVAFHINALYSPWIRLGDVAYKFLKSKDDQEALRNFINSWLAEPWEDKAVELSRDLVMDRQSEYEEGVVPNGAMVLTGGVDVQQDCMYWTVRAWAPRLTSWNVAHGIAMSWDDIELVMNRPYKRPNGEEMIVSLCAMDSGDQTDEVYDFCAINQEWAIPVKGASHPMLARYRISTIDKPTSRANGMRLVMVDGGQYKSMIAGRMNRPNGSGSWMVYKDCDEDYAEQVTAEQKITEMKNGREVVTWKKKSTHAANHYFDAEVYCACAGDLMQVRYLEENEPGEQLQGGHDRQPDSAPQSGGWLGNSGGSWL